MTSKERARLRGLANGIETVLQIGKDGIGENLIHQADITLEARELIKGRVLEGCANSPREAAEALAAATDSEVIQVIGSKFVLHRKKKSVETEKKASKPRQRENPPPALRDISPKGGDAIGKAGKRFRAPSGTEIMQRGEKRFGAKAGQCDKISGAEAGERSKKRFGAKAGQRDKISGAEAGERSKKRFGAKAGQRDKISGAETGERNKKRFPAPMGRGTGGGFSRPNAFRKSDAAQRASRPGQRKASAGQRKPFSRPGMRKANGGGNRRK